MSNYIFTYQHTCQKGQSAYILKNAAFASVIKKKHDKPYIPFLGSGYYYWEENHEAAHRWGKRQYIKDYNIVEYKDATISRDQLLDFLNRRDLAYYKELTQIYKAKRPETERWLIGQWIEFFKKLESLEPGKFPFRYFRADENFPSAADNEVIKDKKLFNYKGYYAFLEPQIVLCSIEKNDLNCASKDILH